jgi:hypothetical protein
LVNQAAKAAFKILQALKVKIIMDRKRRFMPLGTNRTKAA